MSQRSKNPELGGGFAVPSPTVPTLCTLDACIEVLAASSGIHLATLEPSTVLIVETENTLYRLTVVAPRRGRVVIEGGRLFQEATAATVEGSGLGGSTLKAAWIGAGLCMELRCDGHRVITSPVRSVRPLSAPRPPAA